MSVQLPSNLLGKRVRWSWEPAYILDLSRGETRFGVVIRTAPLVVRNSQGTCTIHSRQILAVIEDSGVRTGRLLT